MTRGFTATQLIGRATTIVSIYFVVSFPSCFSGLSIFVFLFFFSFFFLGRESRERESSSAGFFFFFFLFLIFACVRFLDGPQLVSVTCLDCN